MEVVLGVDLLHLALELVEELVKSGVFLHTGVGSAGLEVRDDDVEGVGLEGGLGGGAASKRLSA